MVDKRSYVLDRNRQPAPMNSIGELYLGGQGLAVGYLNCPELTAERFVRNTQRDEPDDRLYRTGDLVRLLSDGELEFHGRIDNQVKVRGFRVELGEVEAVLGANARVKDCAVVADGDRMIAFVVPVTQGRSDAKGDETLRSHLRQHLPRYMLPSAIVTIEELPLTPNGKVDRRALLGQIAGSG